MDPTNINPNENQTAAMPEMPTPVNPVINPGESAASPTSPVAPEFAATPAPAEAPAMPEMPTFSTIPETPVAAPVAPADASTPAAPVTPAAPLTPEAVAAPVMPDIPEPVNPVYAPGDNVMVGETDPITVPNPPKAPDPIEEELKAPMQAAAPVPGSIGSAISMPAADGTSPVSAAIKPMSEQQTPNVAFNDPAGAQGQPAAPAAPAAEKKKLDKKSLIMLGAIGGIVVIALIVVLISQLG